MKIKNTIRIDLDQKNTLGYAVAVAGDSGTRSVEIRLRNNHASWPIPEGVTASMAYKKSDGTAGWYDTLPDGSAAYTIEGDTITMELAPQVLSVPGAVAAAVVLRDADGDQLTTFDFYINVESSPADAKASKDYYNLKVVASIEELARRVEELARNGGDCLQNGDSTSKPYSPYSGMTLNVLGDSITQLMTQYASVPYHEWMKELLGLAKVNNYGMSGTSIAKNATGPDNAFCVRYADMDDDADIVVVAGGVNDLIHNSTVGEYGDTTPETFYGALHILCNGLRTKYPLAMIFFITPTNYNVCPISTYDRSIYDYVKAIKTICDKFAIPVYDNRAFSGIYPNASQNASKYTSDGLHWNDLGHEIVGKNIVNWMLNLKGYPGYMYIKTGDATDETPEETYSIAYNLSNCSAGNTTTSINGNGAFSTTITANGGYVLGSVSVTMGGKDVTADVYADGVISIDAVSGDIIITAMAVVEESQVVYTITNNLTNATNSNSAESINEGASYSATIGVGGGYILENVTVTMGGEDITSTAVSGGTIAIASVTGDIVVTATAVAETIDVGDGDLYTLAEPITSDGTNGTGINTGVKTNSGAPDITLIVDFQLAQSASYGATIVDSSNGTGKGIRLFCGNGNLGVNFQYGYSLLAEGATDLIRHKIGIVFDRTNTIAKFYVDGTLARTVNNAGETNWLDDNEYELHLLGTYNATYGTANCINGTIYHCDVYSGVLTDEQVIAKMASYE